MLWQIRKNFVLPKLYILDSECSNDLKVDIITRNVKYELVPPYQHRRNTPENAIRMFKNYFLVS